MKYLEPPKHVILPEIEDADHVADGVIYYSKEDQKFKFVENGQVKTLDSGGSGEPAGSNTQIQYNNGGDFGASSDFRWTGDYLHIGALEISKPITQGILQNQTDQVLVSIPVSYKMIYIDYTISRDGETKAGTISVAHNGVSSEIYDTGAQTSNTEVDFDSDIVSGNIRILYSSSPGEDGSIVYSIRRMQ